jgi:hypothetical protein
MLLVCRSLATFERDESSDRKWRASQPAGSSDSNLTSKTQKYYGQTHLEMNAEFTVSNLLDYALVFKRKSCDGYSQRYTRKCYENITSRKEKEVAEAEQSNAERPNAQS